MKKLVYADNAATTRLSQKAYERMATPLNLILLHVHPKEP